MHRRLGRACGWDGRCHCDKASVLHRGFRRSHKTRCSCGSGGSRDEARTHSLQAAYLLPIRHSILQPHAVPVRIIASASHQTRPHRIHDHISDRRSDAFIAAQRMVVIARHPDAAAPAIDGIGDAGGDAFHASHQCRQGLVLAEFDQQMHVIGHQHPTDHSGVAPETPGIDHSGNPRSGSPMRETDFALITSGCNEISLTCDGLATDAQGIGSWRIQGFHEGSFARPLMVHYRKMPHCGLGIFRIRASYRGCGLFIAASAAPTGSANARCGSGGSRDEQRRSNGLAPSGNRILPARPHPARPRTGQPPRPLLESRL